jgi:hypothetical protein
MSNARSGGGGPGTAVPGRAWGRQGKREKGERGGEAGRWVGLWSGAQWQREKAGRVTVGGPNRSGGSNRQGNRGRRGGCQAGPMGFKLKTNFDINFKSIPTWFESKPIFLNLKNSK